MKNSNNELVVGNIVPLGYNTFNHINSAFDSLFHDIWADPGFLNQRNWRFSDVREDEDRLHIEVELPRFTKDEVKVTVKNKSVFVEAKNNRSPYHRTFADSRAEWDKAEVELKNGVLYISAPKSIETKEKQLEIKYKE